MNCIDKGMIQSYLDKELDRDKAEELQRHIESCVACRVLHNEVREARDVALNLVSQIYIQNEEIDIPPYSKRLENSQAIKRNIVFSILKIAAGISLLVATFIATYKIISTRENHVDEMAFAATNLVNDQDPNTAWHQNRMVVVLTDENGNVTDNCILKVL